MTRFERLKESLGFGAKLVPVQSEKKETYQGLDVIFGSSKYNKSIPREYYNGRYIWFGKDNLFPNRLNELYESVSLHSAIVDFKKLMVCGQGYTIDDNGLTAVDKVKLAGIKNFIEEDTTLQEFIENITLDLIIHSTIYIKLYWNEDKTRLIKFERIEPSKIRVGVDLKYPEKPNKYFYSFDWRDTGRFIIREYEPKSADSRNKCEVWRVIKKSPGMLFYTVPTYSAASNWLELDAKIPFLHKSNIENSVNPSKAIFFYSKPANDEARREITRNIERSFSGEENTGKAMVFFFDGKENAAEIQTIQPDSLDKQFKETAVEAARNICYSHKINPIILGLKDGGSMGNPKELLNAYEIFKTNVIEPLRKDVEVIVNQLIKWKGLNVEMKLNNVELFSNLIENNPNTNA